MQTPTQEAYAELQTAFDFFNRKLFGGILKMPMFTLQREKRTYGYCSRQRFLGRTSGVLVDEIAMNPAYFAIRTIPKTLSTLAHEMVHQKQFHHGNPGRRGYHNKEWGRMMEEIGLMPSNTGEPGGAKTGEQMSHYIVKGGAFDLACQELITQEFTLSWVDKYPAERPPAPKRPVPKKMPGLDEGPEPQAPEPDDLDDDRIVLMPGLELPPRILINKTNRSKYYCDECTGQTWGKPGMHLFCGGRTWMKGKEQKSVTHSQVKMREIDLATLGMDEQQEIEDEYDHPE